MRKTNFAYAKNKGSSAIDSQILLIPEPLAIFCSCTARLVSDLVGNPDDRFSHNDEAYLVVCIYRSVCRAVRLLFAMILLCNCLGTGFSDMLRAGNLAVGLAGPRSDLQCVLKL